ncbi:MAG TPA: hypothetical protein VFE55_03585 [Acidimicrobiia bacterium]|nr:hypothetical protein [Acidimicrobiia bacterium]
MNHNPLRRDALSWWRAGVLVVAGALLLAACHSGGSSSSSNSTANSKQEFTAYRQCLLQHGVTRRTPGSTRDPAQSGTFSAARKACRKLRPAGGLRGGGFDAGTRVAFRKCMTDHGVALPNFGAAAGSSTTAASGAAPAPRGGMLAGLDRNDPNVRSALAACRSLLLPKTTTTTAKPK